MRCFIAINLTDSLKKEIEKTTKDLRAEKWDIKWVSIENVHITLKFLGEISEDLAREITDSLSSIVLNHQSFEIKFHGVGVFPDKKRPRVIWIGLSSSDALFKLQEQVEEAMLTTGFEEENRKFSPHLTIGRIRLLREKERSKLLESLDTLKDKDFGNIRVDKVSLMRSYLKPTGAQYETLAEFPLVREKKTE